MTWRYFSGFILMTLFLFTSSFGFANEELLDESDIHKVMDEILEKHVDKHEVSNEVIKQSFKIYIDQFDPERIYLFESEVNGFLNLDSSQLDHIRRQYQNNDYSKYEELNNVIQNAARRARTYRSELMKRGDYLFQKSTDDPSELQNDNEDVKSPFPKTVPELKGKIENEIVFFISRERQRYGDRSVMENKSKTLQAYNRLLQHKENQYLFQGDTGLPLSPQEKKSLLVMHILKALTKSLDSHTAFLNSEEAYDMKIRLEKGFQGIGVILQRSPEGITISRLVKDGPAQRSGLVKVGDIIMKINGENVEYYTLEELVNRLRDASNKDVILVLKRKAKESGTDPERTISVTLTRELIAVDEGRVDVQEEKFLDGIIGKITLYSFYQGANGVTSEKDVRKAIKELKSHGQLKGIILDLRENSGGFLNQAVKVAGLFITNGVVVVSKYSNGEQKYYRDVDGKVVYDGPLIVLTSKATASAAEIVAQALQDYGVAIVVGDEQTYGKGTIQSQTVTDGASTSHFKVTVGKYYTVSGRTPQVRGVKADVIVPSHYNNEIIGEEYLQHPIGSDTINPTYRDGLADIDPGLKPWYLRYYMPTIQKKEISWDSMIPTLKLESEKRMVNNMEYQQFLNGGDGFLKFGEGLSENNSNISNYQMNEAVNILKDMITIEKKFHQSSVADY